MVNVVFLARMIPDSMKEEVAQKSSHNMQDATMRWKSTSMRDYARIIMQIRM